MDLSKVSFTSQHPIDRLAMQTPLTGTRVMPGSTAFSSFTVTNPVGTAFIPFIRYSIDGGVSWQENGSPFRETVSGSPMDTVSMTAKCSNTTVTIYDVNNNTASRTVLWEVYGVVRD